MKEAIFPEFKERYATFKQTKYYTDRQKQLTVAEIFKEIIFETIKNEPFSNEHLTRLVQMFKFGCKNDTFYKYLDQNVQNSQRVKELSERYFNTDKTGFTGAGLNSIKSLNPKQLARIKRFIQDSFNVKTLDEAVELSTEFEDENIPYVTSGIYSPWLYYINPHIFPILNNSWIFR